MSPGRGAAGRPAIVGRGVELSKLRAGLQEVLDGSGRLILLAGEVGIGKTRIAEELARDAGERGAHVAWGRCWGENGAPDLWPWMQVIRSCMRAVDPASLRQLVGPHGSELTALVALRGTDDDAPPSSASPTARFRLFNAIAHFLEAYSALAPLMIILEDLHRADPASLLLLQFFTQEQRERRILLVGTFREPGMASNRPFMQTVIEAMREPGSERLTLGGLSLTETGSLLGALLEQEVSPDVSSALHRRTDGNPLFLVEYARQLRELTPVERAACDLAIPGVLGEILEQRLEPFSAQQRGLLALAAASARDFRHEELTPHALGDDRLTQVKALIADAELHGLLRPGPSTGLWRFAHELMREWLAGEAPIVVSAPNAPPPVAEDAPKTDGAPAIFRREGEYWRVAFAGQTALIKDAKGLAYVAFLLRQPHREVHVTELANLGASPAQRDELAPSATLAVRFGLGDAGAVIDSQAKAAYRMRLEELRAELIEAESFHDLGRSERAQREIQFLTNELAAATGMGGRDRRMGSAAERARINITRAVMRAVARIDESNASLAQHLRRALKTGTFCVYAPDGTKKLEWEI